MPSPAPAKNPADDIEEAVEEAIRLCGGDPRKAIRGLILAQRVVAAQVSRGYVRSQLQ